MSKRTTTKLESPVNEGIVPFGRESPSKPHKKHFSSTIVRPVPAPSIKTKLLSETKHGRYVSNLKERPM